MYEKSRSWGPKSSGHTTRNYKTTDDIRCLSPGSGKGILSPFICLCLVDVNVLVLNGFDVINFSQTFMNIKNFLYHNSSVDKDIIDSMHSICTHHPVSMK